MKHKLVVFGYDSGLNELLKAQEKRYDARLRRYRVFNNEKNKNDKLCIKAIQRSQLKNVRIDVPVSINYTFYVKDKKHDRSNIVAGFIKSFEDALQKCKVIQNDTWDLVLDSTKPHKTIIDRDNPRVEIEIIEVERR